jgi:two-component system nitrogen regulation response regulator GlnG
VRSQARLIAATDRPLETSGFNLPLLRRLQTFTLFTPSLRSRREDLGVLARQAWQDTGAALDDLADMPTELARALCLHDWPGNVRQLEQAMRRLALDRAAGLWPSVEALLGEPLRLPPDTAASARVAWAPSLPAAPPPGPRPRTPRPACRWTRPRPRRAPARAPPASTARPCCRPWTPTAGSSRRRPRPWACRARPSTT